MSGPTLTSPTPDPNAGLIAAGQPLGFTLGDTTDPVAADITVEITATYPSGAVELVYGPTTSGFTALYAVGSIAASAVPGAWSVSRAGGWPANPTLSVFAVDANGLSARTSWTWRLVSASVAGAATSFVGAPQQTAVYGTDSRTFLNLGSGPDLDPYLLIVSDPRIVMSEAIARRVTMLRGALFYSLNDGYDLRQLLNAALTQSDITSVQQAIQQECLKDPRVQSASVQVVLDRATSTMTVNIGGTGAAGPFSCVFSISSMSGAAVITALQFQ